jgi:hypothetical protein
MPSDKRRRLYLLAMVSLAAIVVWYGVFLSQPSRFPEIKALTHKPITRTAIVSTAGYSHVIEPHEYLVYEWSEPFRTTRTKLGAELRSKGFRLVEETPVFASWRRDEFEICLYGSREQGLSTNRSKKSVVPDLNYSQVVYWRLLDYSWPTQLRVWLSERKSDSR